MITEVGKMQPGQRYKLIGPLQLPVPEGVSPGLAAMIEHECNRIAQKAMDPEDRCTQPDYNLMLLNARLMTGDMYE